MCAHPMAQIQSFAKKESIAWPWEPTKEAAMAEFNRVWDVLKIVSTKEVTKHERRDPRPPT